MVIKLLFFCAVDVILIEPGPIKTAIWNKTPDPNNNQFIGSCKNYREQ